MSAPSLYRQGGGYWITPEGRQDLARVETCRCRPRLVGLLVECPDCGTVYGHMREQLLGGFSANRKPD